MQPGKGLNDENNNKNNANNNNNDDNNRAVDVISGTFFENIIYLKLLFFKIDISSYLI